MSHFSIRCRKCGKVLENAYCAFCEHCVDALLVTQYNEKQLDMNREEGAWKFGWLPVHSPGFSQPAPAVYRSVGFGRKLGIPELYIAFCGYWPEKGAHLETCTFKEFEAAVVIQNAMENGMQGLVVASAGNTARAFDHLSFVSGFPAIIIVPAMCLPEMWYLVEDEKIRKSGNGAPTLAVSDGDYSDSINMAKRIALVAGIPFEGGVKNIAKRDGLGIVMMEAVHTIGRLPRHYFQAVGSGAGAIAAWEMSERFLNDGRFGDTLPVLHLAQNLPFAPMTKAYWRGKRELAPEDLDMAFIGETTTRVLSNRYPAYGVLGGIFDALEATGGRMYGITNEEVYAAMEMFEDTEGIDLVPAAGVAAAALIQAVRNGKVGGDGPVLLNITGGGEKRLRKDRAVKRVSPLLISKNMPESEIERLLRHAVR